MEKMRLEMIKRTLENDLWTRIESELKLQLDILQIQIRGVQKLKLEN